jgi:hypothetical protein
MLSEEGNMQPARQKVVNAQEAWEASMEGRLEELRLALRREAQAPLAARCGAELVEGGLRLVCWGTPLRISWPGLEAYDLQQGKQCGVIDTAVLMYYLKCADGASLADRWVAFHELPGGAFYHQAFQSYAGDRLAKALAADPDAFHRAARQLGGLRLAGLSEYAYSFQPLPRLRLAAIFWPGDEEIPGRGAVLFDAASLHYMVLDGLAILGSRLVGRLLKAR